MAPLPNSSIPPRTPRKRLHLVSLCGHARLVRLVADALQVVDVRLPRRRYGGAPNGRISPIDLGQNQVNCATAFLKYSQRLGVGTGEQGNTVYSDYLDTWLKLVVFHKEIGIKFTWSPTLMPARLPGPPATSSLT